MGLDRGAGVAYSPSNRPATGAVAKTAILGIGSIILIAVLAYVAAGLVYTKVRLDAAQGAYRDAVDHQTAMAALVNSLNANADASGSVTSSAAELQKDHDVLVSWTQAAEGARLQIDIDDDLLADAGANLRQDPWLSPFSQSDFQRAASRIVRERRVLADARTIVVDYVQVGSFYVSLSDVLIDFYDVTGTSIAKNLDGTKAAIAKLRADAAKAIALDKSPGLAPEVDQVMRLIQRLGADMDRVLSAALARNLSAFNAAKAAGSADVARIRAVDTSQIVTKMKAFYAPLIDAYNSDAAAARAAG